MYKKKISILAILSIFTILICTAVTFASVLFRSFVESEGTITTGSVDKIVNINDANESPVQISSSTQTINFTKAGDSTTLTVKVNNNIASVVQYKYEFAFSSIEFQTESFASCILVYFNGEFIDTLGDICASANARVANGYIDFSGYVNKATSDAASSVVDTLTFELHTASDLSAFNNSNAMSFKLRVYAQTADYEHNMFVSTESELKKAFNDLNLGVLPKDEKIVLFNNITLSSDFDLNYPVQIDLNGYKLDVNSNLTFKGEGTSSIFSSRKMSISSLDSTGSIKVNNSKGILDIQDFYNSTGANIGYLYSDLASATSYDSTLLSDLVEYRVANKLRYGIKVNENINLFGGLTFYNLSVTPSNNLNYSKPNLSVKNSVDYNDSESITIAIGSNLKIGVKILCTENDLILADLLANELKHLADLSEKENGNLKRTNAADLFLPTSIKSKNVTIEWVSSDESLISNTGVVSSNISGDATLTIYAHININDEVITYAFDIKTMSQNHETIFQYFVAQLSPIEMEEIFTGSNQSSSYYYLPIVDSDYDPIDNSSYTGYDYRATYKTPSSTETYTWEGFNNVGFEYITYTPISTYSFVSLEQIKDSNNIVQSAAVYLNSATFQSFAQVQVSAKFAGDEEVYTAPVNLIVKLGYSTELNELVFNKVNEDLSEINVLQNILNTRMATTNGGMKNEKGDFYLDGSYQTYKISYSIPTSSQYAISKIEGYTVKDDGTLGNLVAYIEYGETFTSEQVANIGKYKICLNIEGFDTSDSNFGITTILSMPGVQTTASRILYFKCPGIIKNDDTGFANMSVFNSVKYQVYSELCTIDSEQGTDDVEDKDYTVTDNASFSVSGSNVTNYTGAYILRHDANLCTKLAFSLAETSTNTNSDNHIVYGLAKIIDWAVGTDSTTFGAYFDGILDSSFISNYSSVKSNGLTYLSVSEIEIIKNYYSTYVPNGDIDTLWDDVIYYEQSLMVDNTTQFFNEITEYINGSESTYGKANNDNQLIKIQDIYEWVTAKMFTKAYPDGGVNIPSGAAPDGGLVGSGEWTIDVNASYDSWTLNSKYMGSSNYGSQYYNSKYFKSQSSHYVQDTSKYINDVELEILIVSLLNCRVSSSTTTGSSTNYKTAAKQKVYNIIQNNLIHPTVFTETGIAELINQAYINLSKTVSYTGFTSELKSFSIANDSFETPTVTSFDYSTIGFDYFPNLKTLYIVGDYSKLKAFHTETALMNCFNRIINNNDKLENIAFEYCSDSSMDFSLKNIYNAKNLKKIDLYHNLGITNIGALLKLELSQLTYVDVADINLKFDYYEFVLQAINLKASNPLIYYQPDNTSHHATYTTSLSSDAEGLIYLEEFYELIGENSSLTENVYVGNTPTTIQWKIEEGNGINYVNSGENVTLANDAYTLKEVYFKYYLVLNTFIYGNYTFEANHIYAVYNDGNGNVAFSPVLDDDGDEIIVTIGTAPNNPSETIINGYIERKSIVPENNSSSSETSIEYNVITNPNTTNNRNSIATSSSSKSLVIKDINNETLATFTNGRGLYFNNDIVSRNKITTTTNYNHSGEYNFEMILYYATLTDGYYIINVASYDVYIGSDSSYTTTTLTQTESFNNIIYRRGTNGYYSLLNNYPQAYYIVFNGSTYTIENINKNGYSYSINQGTTTHGDPEYFGNEITYNGSDPIYSCAPLSTTIIGNMNEALYNKYVKFVVGTTTYCSYYPAISLYDNGVLTSINYGSYAGYAYQIGISSSGFTYNQIAANSNVSEAYKYVKKMLNILDEANTHLTDQAFGLYYHNYYAFMCDYDFSYQDYSFKAHGIYYLEIGTDGRFYWTQSQNQNETYYTVVDGLTTSHASHDVDDRIELFTIASNLTASDVGKIYYYIGNAVNDGSTGTDEFYQAVYNSSTGLYELKRFGVLDWKYYACSATGDYYDSDSIISNNKHIPSANNDAANLKFKVLCNQMAYVDSSFLWGGNSSSYYKYGVGGTRQAVFTAVITVNGVKYERKFVINVQG